MNLDSLEAQARRAIANDHNTAVWHIILQLIKRVREIEALSSPAFYAYGNERYAEGMRDGREDAADELRRLNVDYDVLVKHYAELEAERDGIVECECGISPEIRRVS